MRENDSNLEVPEKKAANSGAFARDVVWVAIAQLFTSLIFGIATLPALTKHYSSAVYGIWVQILITVTLLSPFFAMELDMAVVRFLSGEENKTARRRALGAMLSAILAISILAFIVINLIVSQLSDFFFASPQYTTFVRLTFLWVISDAFFVFLSSYFRARNKIRLLAIRQMIYSTAVMVIVILLTTLGLNLEWIVGCVIAVQAILALIFFIMIVRENGWPVLELHGLKKFLVFSLPQIPGTALLWLIAFSDRYFITHFLNLSQAGIYSSSSQLAGLTRLFYTPICYVLYPALTRLWDEQRLAEVKEYLHRSTRFLLTLGIPAAVGIALLSQPILQILTTSEFLAGQEVVLFIAIGAIFLGIFQINQHVILLARQTKLLPPMIAAASATSVIMNITLISRLGINGAAVSNIASYFVLAAVATIFAMKYTGYSLDFKFLVKIIGATIPMGICLYFLKVNSIWGILGAIIIGAILFVAGLILLRAFSEQDKLLIKKTFNSLVSGYFKVKNKSLS